MPPSPATRATPPLPAARASAGSPPNPLRSESPNPLRSESPKRIFRSVAPLSHRGVNAPRWPQVDLAHLLALLEKARPSSLYFTPCTSSLRPTPLTRLVVPCYVSILRPRTLVARCRPEGPSAGRSRSRPTQRCAASRRGGGRTRARAAGSGAFVFDRSNGAFPCAGPASAPLAPHPPPIYREREREGGREGKRKRERLKCGRRASRTQTRGARR
jgi:hypothetical protein